MKAPFRIAHEYCVETGKDKYWAEQLCSFLWFSWYEYIGSLNMYSSTLNVIRNKYADITPIDEYTRMLEPGSLQFAQAQIDVAMQACVDYGSMTGDESIADNAIGAIAKVRGDV